MVTVVTIKQGIKSIVTIDTTVTELKKDYYKTKESVDFKRFLRSIYNRKKQKRVDGDGRDDKIRYRKYRHYRHDRHGTGKKMITKQKKALILKGF